MKLVRFDKNWADEMDVEGFRLFTDPQWLKYRDTVLAAKSFNFYFGTNEGWGNEYDEDFTDGETMLKEDFRVFDLTDSEAATIQKFFGNAGGMFPDADSFEDEPDYA